ncbi:MAG: T9SS type A sorting domain-containing protein [Bacteroidales bacterium]|nr:T9SS type A sorting domain-containing protein [Bacteroidales bacterium]
MKTRILLSVMLLCSAMVTLGQWNFRNQQSQTNQEGIPGPRFCSSQSNAASQAIAVPAALKTGSEKAQIIQVPGNYTTIQAAINAANPGDTILVAEGTYFENINFLGKKPLVLTSHFILDGDTNHIANTIINGSQPVYPEIGSVITFELGEDTTSVVCGFTITGGTGTIEPSVNMRAGGGVHIKYSGGKLLNNYIQYNTVTYNGSIFGGGLQTGGPISEIPWIVLRGNRIMHNQAISNNEYADGGGLICFYHLIMTDNEVSYNCADGPMGGAGGGIVAAGSFGVIDINISNNVITQNVAKTDVGTNAYATLGGGIALHHNIKGKIANNLIAQNNLEAPGTYWSWGPGVFIQDININDFVVENNQIMENFAVTTQSCRGGGLALLRSGGTYMNNVVQNNSSSHGGGFCITNSIGVGDTAIMVNNTITGNVATFGGGMYLQTSDAVAINSIIWGNTATTGPAFYETGSNLQVRYSDVQGATIWPGEGNLICEPNFLDDGFHLNPDCQLVNTGIESININGVNFTCPITDIDEQPRPYGGAVPDMGADEVQGCLASGITFSTQEQIDNFQGNYSGCADILGDILIEGNNITNLNGLNALHSITGNLTIMYNPNLSNLAGLNNLETIGGYLYIIDNPSLSSLTGLEGLVSTGAWVQIMHNNLLTNFSGLNNLQTVGEKLAIVHNNGITSLEGLNNLSSIGGDLAIAWSPTLLNLSGLNSLTSIGGMLVIGQNPLITGLAGLGNISANSITDLKIYINAALSTCDVMSICEYLASPGGTIEIHDNAPGCNSPEEVIEACLTPVAEVAGETSIRIIPNPARDMITLYLPMRSGNAQLTLFNITGEKLLEKQITRDETQVDISMLPKGMYFLRLQYENDVKVAKIIKD